MSTNTTADTIEAPASKSSGHILVTIARLLLGLMFLVFGLNGFFHFIPMPKTPPPPGVITLMGAFAKVGYFMPMIFATQTIVGVLLLTNTFVPLALALIAPVIVNIILFHIFLSPATIGPGIVVTLLEIFLVWSYRGSFAPMLALKTKHTTG